VWAIETVGGIPEAPEQRAALEARLRERAVRIADVSVRRHYSQAFDEKISSLFVSTRGNYQGRGRGGRNGYEQRRSAPRGNPRTLVSDTLRNSRLMKAGAAADVTPREAVIILSLVNHPELAQARLEPLAELEFQSLPARQALAAFIDLVSVQPDLGPNAVHEALIARGHGPILERMRTLLARQGVWQVDADTAQIDAETGLKHALALHYKSVQLNRELRAAETALGEDLSDQSFERLRDIQNQISSVDGTEALIEGFGSLSGRATRSL
jgi:DNA primase